MSFATPEDVSARVGRDFTDREVAMTQILCDGITSLIAMAVYKDDAWATGLSDAGTIPTPLRMLCLEKCLQVMETPIGATMSSEQLGSYQYTLRYQTSRDGGSPLMLTESEQSLARKAVFGAGSTSGSWTPTTIADELYDAFFDDCGS